MRKTILLLLILLSNLTFAQRKLPYPIILIHGWTGGSAETWTNFSNYLRNEVQLTVFPIDLSFQLNTNVASSTFTGNSLLGWAKYNVNTSLTTVVEPPPCNFPSPKLDANLYELCEGIMANILVNQTYDSYSWRKDGKELKLTTTDNFSITEPGLYSVEVGKCGSKLISNTISIIGKANPKPTLTLELRTDRYVLTSSGKTNQWQQDGLYVGKATVGSNYQTETEGTYAARAYYDNGCNSISNSIMIKTEKPNIKIANNALFCQGDTVKLETDKLFSKYRWIIGKDTITTTTNTLLLTKASTVSVIAYRGIAKSPKSDSIVIKITPLPVVPTIFVTDKGLVSSSTNGNQWYSNSQILPNETAQLLTAYQGGGYYVKVSENGCSTRSATFTITATETPLFGAMKAYPNPTNGIINITLPSEDAYKMQITDLKGIVLLTKEGKNDTQLELNLSAWNTGIYFVNLSTKNRVFNSKIIVE